MKQVLFINGCIRGDSRTLSLARGYLHALQEREEVSVREVCVTQLPIKPFDEKMLVQRQEDIACGRLEDYTLAHEFAAADVVVMAAPYWDSSFPAKLKTYIEHVCVQDVTFGYEEDGSWKKLCRAERLVYITTAGGAVRRHPSVQLYLEELCEMFVISDVRFFCAEKMDTEPERVQERLDETLARLIEDIGKPTTRLPVMGKPSLLGIETIGIEEEIVSLGALGIRCDSQYYKQGIIGSYPDCYARKSVAERLLEAQSYLPEDVFLKVYDAYRPVKVQQSIWDKFRGEIAAEHPEYNDEELDTSTMRFVARPTLDPEKLPLHSTGGAVDLTLVYEDGEELDMGTAFDCFRSLSNSAYFETNNENLTARENRRLLCEVMCRAGFTNLPSEWWHFDYGTRFWAKFKNCKALYKGVVSCDFPDQLL